MEDGGPERERERERERQRERLLGTAVERYSLTGRRSDRMKGGEREATRKEDWGSAGGDA